MGKFLGLMIGLVAGGLFGAVLGFFIGMFIDRSVAIGAVNLGGSANREAVQQRYFTTTFSIMGHLAKADGRVSEEEIQLAENLMQRMGLTAEHRQEAIRLFKRGSESEFDLAAELTLFRAQCGRRATLIHMLLVTLISVAFADGELHPAEKSVLQQVAASLGIQQHHFEQILGMVAAQQGFSQRAGGGSYAPQPAPADLLEEAYRALGANPSASDKEVKRAYRKLMSKHHPDKLIAQGLPDDMIALATEKAQEIQQAYDLIEKHRKRV
ncbi:MAG: co-chaperone DjlA [Pseudomonadales bacterium]